MKRVLQLFIFFATTIFSFNYTFAQTGPGGIGNRDGSNGQPENELWFDASLLGLTNGSNLTTWADNSGNGNDATQPVIGQQPIFYDATEPGYSFPVVYFDGTDDFLPFDGNSIANKDYTIIMVERRPTGSEGFTNSIMGGTTTSSNQNLHIYFTSTQLRTHHWGNDFGTDLVLDAESYSSGGRSEDLDYGIFTTRLRSSDATEQRRNYQNNHFLGFLSNNSQLSSWDGAALARASNGTTYYSNVEFAEVIIFSSALNAAQLEIVHNYLSEKYGIAIDNDRYTAASGYDYKIAGIGNLGGEKHSRAGSDGFYVYEDNGSLGNGEFIFFSHNNATNDVANIQSGTNVTNCGAQAAWNRSWYIARNGTAAADVKLIFDFPEAFVNGQYPSNKSNYVLLYKANTGDDYSQVATTASGLEDADQIYFDVPIGNLADGYYTIGTLDNTDSPMQGISSKTWYALKSGNWDDWETWTLDPSGNLPNNPLQEIPIASSKIVIHSGKTVDIELFDVGGAQDNTAFVDNKTVASVTVEGRLDLHTTSGHNFTEIRGNGRIFMSADNFPAGDASHFYTKGRGEGTVVYQGTGYNLSTAREFYNMIVEHDDVLPLLANYQINGDLTITTGVLQINDATDDRVITLDVVRDVLVEAGGQIAVGTGNPIATAGYSIGGTVPTTTYHEMFHKLTIGRNLTNNGTINLTNQLAPDYGQLAPNGAATLIFNQAQNAEVQLNGITNIYNLIIDKGTDQTYKLTINPSNTANFVLFGPNNLSNSGSTPNPIVRKALYIKNGTLKLTGSTSIPTLSEGGVDWAVGQTACLWIAGAGVSVYTTASDASQVPASSGGLNTGSGVQALSLFGKFRITDGFFGTRNSAGFIFWSSSNAQVQVEGGITNVSQFRSGGSGGGVASYTQTLGQFIVRGNRTEAGEINSSFPLFGLEDENGVFTMSGGEILVQDISGATNGDFYIPSAEGNYNVTGGKVTIELENNVAFNFYSTAGIWNLHLINGTGTTLTDVDLGNKLNVLNNLTIDDYARLDVTGTDFDVSIGGNFTIELNGEYQDRNATTILEGENNSLLTFNNRTDSNGEEVFYRMVIDKGETSIVSLASGKTNLTGNNNNLLQINGPAFILKKGILDNGNYSVRLYTDTVINYGTFGVYDITDPAPDANPNGNNDLIIFRPDPFVLITNSESVFGNVRLNNGSNIVDLMSDVYMQRMEYRHGRINLGIHNLKLDELYINLNASETNGGINSVEDMFITSGNASDGGLSLLVDGNGTYVFPLGVGTDGVDVSSGGNSKYTPAELIISNFSDDGYITVNPVDHYLWTLTGGSTSVLDYYWKIRQEDFTTVPDVYSTFNYHDSDVDGSENSYRAARVVNITTIEELGNGSVDDGLNEIYYENGTLTEGDYTAGNPSVFNSSVRKLYARKNGLWHDNETWSTTRDGSNPLNNNQFPEPGDICIIGTDNTNYTVAIDSTDAVADPVNVAMVVILRYGAGESSLLSIGQTGSYCNFGIVTNHDPDAADPESTATHASKIIISGPDLPSGDFGEFLTAPNTLWTYSRAYPGSNINVYDENDVLVPTKYYYSYTIGNSITEYPVLQFEYSGINSGYIELPDVDITVNNDIRFFKDDQHIIFNSATNGDVTVIQDIEFNAGNSWDIEFQGSGTPRTLTVYGNINFVNHNGTYSVENLANDITHTIKLQGNVIAPSAGSDFNCYNGPGNAHANLEFIGEQNSDFANMAAVPSFNQIIMNKGTDQTYYALMNSNFSLGANAAGETFEKPIQLQNGTLILNNSNIEAYVDTAFENFEIPSSACLEVRDGTVNIYGDNTGISLDGKLLISNNGIVDMSKTLVDGNNYNGNNFIEYSSSGNATIEVTGSGQLLVGSQIRRKTTTDEGKLIYIQSGGTVIVGQNTAPENDRGVFEILNYEGTSFTHSGGSFTIVRQQTNPTVAAFYFDPETANLTDGTEITIGNANTPVGQNIGLYIKQPIKNLVIEGNNSPIATLWTVPLTLDNLTINNAYFDANGLQLNIAENFENNGTFTHSDNLTVFDGIVDQEILGSSATTFWQLTKSSSTNLTLQNDIQIDDDLRIEAGVLADNSHEITLLGDIYNIATHSYGGTGDGITFAGNTQQALSGNGGIYGKLTVNNYDAYNPSGVKLTTEADEITITNSLKLVEGLFDIGENLLVMEQNAVFIEQNPFSEINMVQTNTSFTDSGIKKFFPSGAGTFTYPLGAGGKYTPVTIIVSENPDANGYLIVKASDEFHPTITKDAEAPDFEIVDEDNVLQYYWSLKANGFTNATGNVEMYYHTDDVKITNANGSSYTVADYITARLLHDGLGSWNKYDWTDFDEVNERLIFRFANVTDAEITGDYTAGIQPNTVTGYGAIPDNVPSFISNGTGGGDWTTTTTWLTYPGGTVPGDGVPTGGPRGAIVIIDNGDNVSMNQNYLSSYSTEIRGTLEHGTTYGNRVGIVTGTGTLSTETELLPAGYYEEFLSTSGGTLEYTGSSDVDILNNLTVINNLIVSGTGERRWPNVDFTIQGNLTIEGSDATLDFKNEHFQKMTVYGDIVFNQGTFTSGTGVSSIVEMAGSSVQTIRRTSGTADFTGTDNDFNHFIMNNINGVVLDIPIQISGNLTFSEGVITSDATNTLHVTNTSETAVSGAGNGKYVDGPMLKSMAANSFEFPVGDAGRYGRMSVLSTSVTGTWEVEYYNHNPNNEGYNPATIHTGSAPDDLTVVSDNEYWRVEAPSATTAELSLRYDGQSGFPVNSQMKIAEWQALSPDAWDDIASNSPLGGMISSNSASISFNKWGNGNFFTLATTYTPQTINWLGGTSVAWENSVNWSSGTVPTALDNVTTTGTPTFEPTISSAAECNELIISSGRTLTVSAGNSLTTFGNFTIEDNGLMILKSPSSNGMSGSFIDNGNITLNGTGTVQVERYFAGNMEAHYVSSPIQISGGNANSTLFTRSTSAYPAYDNPNFYRYREYFDLDGNNTTSPNGGVYNSDELIPGWEYAHNDDNASVPVNMEIGRGYSFRADGNLVITFEGTPNTGDMSSGTYLSDMSYTLNDPPVGSRFDGWHLVGNPYPSCIDWDLVRGSLTNVDDAIYIWDGTQYTSYVAGVPTHASIQDNIIAPMQGFFVHTNANNAQIPFNNSHRVHSPTTTFKNSPVNEAPNNFVRLKLDANNYTDNAVIYFKSNATEEFDGIYDAFKIFTPDYISTEVPHLFSVTPQDKTVLSINTLPDREINDLVVPLGVKILKSGEYTISVDQFNVPNVNVYLIDKQENRTLYLNLENTYTFNFTAGDNRGRFELRFKQNTEPQLVIPVEKQFATEEQPFTFTFDANTFTEMDQGDQIVTYKATLSNGTDLPSWLSFNPDTRIFSGTPGNNDVGSLSVKLVAVDVPGGEGVTDFELEVTNVNDAPELVSEISNQQVDEDTNYSFAIPSITFRDVDAGDVITLAATLENGSALPDWLAFDPTSNSFTGTPGNNEVGLYNIKVTATDTEGAFVADVYSLEVINVNDNPELANLLPDQEINEKAYYSYTIPANTFTDIDVGDVLSLSVSNDQGGTLPTWLIFDTENWMLYGTAVNPGEINIKVTATDNAGASVSDDFKLTVKSTTNIDEYEFKNISIYPNPTKGKLVIESKSSEAGTRFIVRDYHGKTILEKQSEGTKTEINLSEFADGVYFIEISNNKNTKVFKVILKK